MMKKSLLLLILSYSLLSAQETQIIHHMNWVPQSLRSNPAQLPDYKFFIGIPAASSVYLGVDHGISFKDVFQRLPGDTMLMDPAFLLKNLKKDNFIGVSADLEILSFGFRVKSAFLSFSLAERNRFRFSFPKSLIEFAWKGNGAFMNEAADLSGLAVEASAYGEAAVGLALPVRDRWILAGRFKYLSGLAHAHINTTSLEIATDPETYAIQFRSGLDLYSTGADLRIDEDISFDIDPELFKFRNPGMALDLAATYMPTEKWRISGGVTDLGYIRWEAAARRHYVKEGTYTFSGLEIADVFKSDSLDFDGQFDKILDTLKIIFDVQSEDASYTRQLRPVFFGSAEYQFNHSSRLGALVKAEYFADRLHPTINLAYHQRLGRILSLSGSYTLRNRSYYDIGGGFSLKLGPAQFYLMGDNIFSLFWPEDIRSYSVHFGLNLVFGRSASRMEKLIQKLDELPSED